MRFLILVCRRQLRQALSKQLDDTPREIDMLQWMSRTALELIGQAGVGVSFDPLTEDKENPYADAMKAFQYVFMYCNRYLSR